MNSRRRVNSTVGHPSLVLNERRKMKLASLAILVLTITVSAQTKPPAGPDVVAAVAPRFPAIAASANATGDVIVEVIIDSSGTVSSAHATAGHPLLKKLCEVTAKRWKFVPATGDKVERTAHLTFSFRVVAKATELDMTPVFFPPYRIEVAAEKPKIETYTVH
jgi:TonB family protein